MRQGLRYYDEDARVVHLSEVLDHQNRTFQLAHVLCLVEQQKVLDELTAGLDISSDTGIARCHVELANYFAAAVLMPYEPFLEAARQERYDLELLGHRFRASFEQVCHRLTSLRRPRAEGVPFHLMCVDVAGNISKRFSSLGMRIARFSGACPRWIIHKAFQTPGMIRVQISRMPDGTTYFCVARTLEKDWGGYHALHAMQAIEIGSPVEYARELVYSDGVDLENLGAAVPVGVTCRLCERTDCEQRAFPALHTPLKIDENLRGIAFYSPVS
jgi:predicted transcriptional regulator